VGEVKNRDCRNVMMEQLDYTLERRGLQEVHAASEPSAGQAPAVGRALLGGWNANRWPAPGCEDTELGVLTGPEGGHGETAVYARVQA
jgi:hypothetical protein